ncbi:MAG: ATP-binding protein [Calothrix sp. MO_192.B10]|nr:ATP-binding protein [Calothrix sp. MO_192.B10]
MNATHDKSIDRQRLASRQRFLRQRLDLWLWLALICVFSFTVKDIYNFFYPLPESQKIPEVLRYQLPIIDAVMLLGISVCLVTRKTKFGRLYPGILFLISSWSISLIPQIFLTLNRFAIPSPLTWSLLFLSQATFMPVRWLLHFISQAAVLLYYFGVNTTLGLKLPPPVSDKPIYNVTLILYLFWLCVICDLGVYLYDRLQRSEFYARKEIEIAYQKLGVAEAKYRSIFENAVEGIFQSTPGGRYITVNPALARILGYSSPGDVMANFTDIEHQLYVEPQRRAEFIRSIEREGLVSEFESQIYRRDRSIVWISEKAYVVRDENGKTLYYEGLIEDITKRKQAEETLKLFFHAVSHDLRNPVLGTLMVLKNLLHQAQVEESPNSSLIPVPRQILERMVQSSDRQLDLINSLMEAHINEVKGLFLQLQPIQLHRVLADTLTDLEPILAENQATLNNLLPTDLPLVNADAIQLWRVFSNLIGNAVKHNPPGLEITINAKVEGDRILCTVADNGVGMSQQQCDRLFEPYAWGSNLRNSVSLGLGLYLCKQIINAHGGEIGASSTMNAGATLWFTLFISSVQRQ